MIAFPVTPEAFISYQEAEINRELDDFERELAAVVVEFANASYQEGLNGEENTTTMDFVRAFYGEREKSIDSFIRNGKASAGGVIWHTRKGSVRGRAVRSG